MTFVDTNYFLRYLLDDNGSQHKKAVELFRSGASDSLKLFSSTIVFFELYWVLSSYYKKNKSEISGTLDSILSLEFIKFEQRNVLRSAVQEYASSSFCLEDCYNLEYARASEAREFATFDEKLLKEFRRP